MTHECGATGKPVAPRSFVGDRYCRGLVPEGSRARRHPSRRANEFAATTTRSPPARTVRRGRVPRRRLSPVHRMGSPLSVRNERGGVGGGAGCSRRDPSCPAPTFRRWRAPSRDEVPPPPRSGGGRELSSGWGPSARCRKSACVHNPPFSPLREERAGRGRGRGGLLSARSRPFRHEVPRLPEQPFPLPRRDPAATAARCSTRRA